MGDALGDLLRTWIRVLGSPLPSDIVQLYSLMCHALWFGERKVSEPPKLRKNRGKQKKPNQDYFFADWTLLSVKGEVDAKFRELESGLRRWERQGKKAGAQAPGPDRAADLQRTAEKKDGSLGE